MDYTEFPNLSKSSCTIDRNAAIFHSPLLDGFMWLAHGMTTRNFVGPDSDTFELMGEVRRRLVPGGSRMFCGEQVHRNRIEVIRSQENYAKNKQAIVRGPIVQIQKTDALIVSEPALPIAVQTADCVPILLVDVRRRRVAAVHAGRQGSLARIAEKAVEAMVEQGSEAEDVIAWMGPAVSRERYEIAPEMAESFRKAFPEYADCLIDNRLDLILLNAGQLRDAGVPAAQIHAANLCTARHADTCYSYRREGSDAGRMACYAMILSQDPIDAEPE